MKSTRLSYSPVLAALLLACLLLAIETTAQAWSPPGKFTGAKVAKSAAAPRATDSLPLDVDLSRVEPLVLDELAARGQTDFFIWLAEKADLSPVYRLPTKEARGQFVYETLVATADRTQAPLRLLLDEAGADYRPFYIANTILVRSGTEELLRAVAARSDVARITADDVYEAERPMVGPDQPESPTVVEPNLSHVNADDVWALGYTGQGTVVVNHDYGLDWDHPAIINQYRGWNGVTADHNYNWWDATGGSPYVPVDPDGHGTHVTGIMVGDDGGSNQVGMAPGAETIHCRVLGPGGSYETRLECLEWDLAPWDLDGLNPNPAMAPDAVNVAWISTGDFEDAFNALLAAGIFVGKPAGNEGPACQTLTPPTDMQQVWATGAINYVTGSLTSFSSRGPSDRTTDFKPNIVAPGQDIRSTIPGGGYAIWSGTSMASPHSVGLVSLIWSANPSLRGLVTETKQLIADTAVPLTGEIGSNCGGDYVDGPNNDWGSGRIDALAAVQMALQYDGFGTLTGEITDAVSSAPIPGARIEATLYPTVTWRAYADSAGLYERLTFSGTYTVSVTAYGYEPQTVSGVSVLATSTTVQDFSLMPVPTHAVSGTVRDANTGWPLYARISVAGDPVDPLPPADDFWTDPATGFYSITLAEDVTHTFRVESFGAGYLELSHEAAPLTADTLVDFDLELNPLLCLAPGYVVELTAGITETFDGHAQPPGWTVVDNAGTGALWTFTDPGGRGNLTGGEDGFAIADSDAAGNLSMNTELRTPVMDLSGLDEALLAFRYDFRWYSGGGSEVADVDVSTNGVSGPWTNVWRRTGADDRGPQTALIDISSLAAGEPSVAVRFHYYNAFFDWWWQVDDVFIGQWCQPRPGGLVVGQVSDANTGAPIGAAQVTNSLGESVAVHRTPADPAEDEAFFTIFSPAGSQVLTATMGTAYAPDADQVTVVLSDTVRHDFELPAGWLAPAQESLEITLTVGHSATLPLTLTNIGSFAMPLTVGEIDRGFVPVPQDRAMSPGGSPLGLQGWTEATPLPQPVSLYGKVQCEDDPDRFYVLGGINDNLVVVDDVWRYDAATDAWTALAPLPTPLLGLAATCHEGSIYAAGGGPNATSRTDYFFVYDIAQDDWSTGPSVPRTLRGGVLAAWNGHVYLFGGSATAWTSTNQVDVYDIVGGSWSPGTPMPVATHWGGSVQVSSYVYIVGGYSAEVDENVTAAQRYDMATDTWEMGPSLANGRAGFALAATESRLYAIGGDENSGDRTDPLDLVEVLDHTAWPSGAWGDLGDPLPRPYALNDAGFCTEAMAGGEIWSVAGASTSISVTNTNQYRPSEPCFRPVSDVLWLHVAPMSPTLEAGEAQALQVTLDAAAPFTETGQYRAQLRLFNQTPYGDPILSVVMNVVPAVYGLAVDPESAALEGYPGQVVTYALTVTNTGTGADTYDISVAGTWSTTAPATIGPVLPGATTTLEVDVAIPPEADEADFDVTTVTVTSATDPLKSAMAILTTAAAYDWLYLPLLGK